MVHRIVYCCSLWHSRVVQHKSVAAKRITSNLGYSSAQIKMCQ